MRALVLAALAIASCTSAPPPVATPSPSPEPGVLTVTALLDLSGPRAAVGAQQRSALQLWTDQQGRGGVPVRLRTVDVAGSDAKLLIELRRAAVEERADAVIVGPPVGYAEALGRALDVATLPVVFLEPLPAEPSGGAGGRWAFGLAPSLERLAGAAIDDAERRDVLTPSIVLGEARERVDPVGVALDDVLGRRGLDPLTRVAMPSDGSIPPVVRSGLSVLRSVHCLTAVTACAAVAREARAMGSPAMVYLPYLVTGAEAKDDRDLAQRAVWPSSRTLIPAAVLRLPEEHARAGFLKAYGEKYGVPSVHAAAAFDALSLLASAAERAGPDDRTALRDALERITMPLIATTYSFAPDRHLGADPGDVVYVRWSGAPVLAPLFGSVVPTPTPTPSPSPRSAPPSPSAIP